MSQDPRRLADVLAALLQNEARPQSGAGRADSGSGPGKLLFLGNPQDPCPRLLLLDARLQPIDIVTWQVIRIHSQPGESVAFPSYLELMRWVRASRGTVARAVLLLRLTRWLLLMAAPRQRSGRFSGNVYALVDESLPFTEMLRLDDGYLAFAEQACTHRSAQVRQVAGAVLDEAKGAAQSSDPAALALVSVEDQLKLRFEQLQELLPPGPGRQVQNLNAVTGSANHRVQNLNSVLCSSSYYINNTTTTSTGNDGESSSAAAATIEFPSELALTDSQHRVLALRLVGLIPSVRQDVLDEATARIVAKRGTADPVRCEFDYVARLSRLALEGSFTLTDAGVRFRALRDARAANERALERAQRESEKRRLEEIARRRERRDER